MLSQQLIVDVSNTSGRLVVTADANALAELQGLAAELALRPTVTTNGNININLPAPEEDPPNG